MNNINNIQVSKNFKLKEFECKDGSHLVKINRTLLEKLQKLRDYINKPIIITSGYRTQEYNKKIGGSPNSQHMLGKAADIQVNGITPEQLSVCAHNIGFNGIGIYKTFIHVDVREYKARWKG